MKELQMKGKITIVLFSLVLVFGMLAASCDNGAFPDKVTDDATTYFAYASTDRNLPKAKYEVDADGKITITEAPALLKPRDVYKKLQEKKEWPVDSRTFVPAYILSKVSTAKPKGQSAYGENEQKLATFYAGMQILIENPDTIPETPAP
jgi:hypothetical protein